MQMMKKLETALFAVVVAFTALPSRADVKESWTVDTDTQLTEDVTVTGTLTVAEGATLDLNGCALAAGAITGAGAIVDSPAAAGYERLEYIASDGQAQYIDTEDSHNASTIVDMRIQFNTTAPQFQAYYGARTGGNASQFGGWVNYSQFRYGYGGDSASNYSVPAVNTTTIYDVHLNKSGQCTVVTNGVVADVFNIGSGNGDNTTLQLTDFLFAINQGSDTAGNKSPQWHANAKIYSCVIRQNGGIAHNFIPVERLSDGKIGMYDSVTGKFHVSGNGKDFIGGAVAAHGLRLTPSAAGAASDFTNLTIGEGVSLSFAGAGKLSANLDATKFASVEIADGATLDLNGHNLTVARLSGGPSGMLTDSANNYYTAMRDSSGNLYLQLEYLQSSGSQYIDTGYRHNANSVADMKVAVTVAPGNTWYCYYGSRTSEGNRNEFAGWVYKTHHWTGVAGAKGEQTSWSFTVNVPFLVHLDGAANATCSVDGHTFTHSNSLTDSGYNDNLFAGRQGSSNPFFAAKAAIYYCTIKEGETVKRDFVAAKRLSDGVLGMLDKENGVFYTNTGSGTFIAGGYAVNAEAAAFGSSGVLRIAVPAGTTLALDDMPLIVGDVKILKEGAGVLTYNEATSSQKYFLGGYEDSSAPVTATWTGAANDNDFDNPENWTCLDGLGNTVAGAVPDARTTSCILAADADWTSKGAISIEGATIDLAGHTLKAKGVSGAGLVSDTTNDAYAFYKTLTYLQSTTVGKQFIDTGYTHGPLSNVRVKFAYPVFPSGLEYFSYFGGGERGYNYSFGGWMHRNGSSYYHYKSLGASGANWVGASAGTGYNLFIRKSKNAGDNGNCYVANEANTQANGVCTATSTADWPSGTTPVTAYLFGHHNLDGTLDGNYAASRIYLCQINHNQKLVRNFVPMKHKVSGKPGMMDKVNNKFYANANPESAEDFIAGPETAAAAPTATAAEIAAAGTFVIDVDEGESVNLSSLQLYGKVKLVKTGLGTLVQDAAPECVCGIEVREGTFLTTAALAASIKVDLSIKAGATVSIACAGATSATMPATVSLEAGAKLLFDMADFSAAEFTLASAGFSFGTGATADGCLVVSNPSYGATLASATSISVTLLTAPVTAVWTGLGEAGNFDDPGNWSCYNKNGATLANTIPDSSTLTFRLATDADWTAKGAIALGAGVTLDLNGHNLTAASITGAGVVTDTSSQRWTLLQDVSGNFYAQLEYLASGTSIDNYNHGKEYIDTGYQHNTKTVVDMKVQILKETTDWYCYYGARNGTANAFAGWIYRDNHYKGVTADGSTSTPYPKNVPYLAHMEFGGTCTFGNVEDSSTYLSYTSGAGGSSGRNDFMFALNQGSGNQFGFNGRIYYCTVKEKTDEAGVYHMIRDFVPAQRLSDGVLGMLDKENGVFYVNNGSGAFVAGPYATEGEAAGAGELHITVADGALSLANMAKIAGNVKIVKDGAGTLTLPAAGQYFTGGLEVAGGTLAMTQTAAFLAGTPITATAGGTIEVTAADGASYANNFTIAGGTLKVVASGTGATTTAAIAGTLALELGANDAQPKVSVDMTDCSSTTFILNTTALTVGEGVTAAPGFVQTPDATFEASIVDGTAIKVERVIAPVTAVWTGLGEAGNFDDPGNWTCYNKNGATLANTTLPDGSTTTFRLAADADWTAKGAIALGSGVTLDLAGHTLTADSVTGSGVVIDSSDNFITASDGSVYQKIQYVQATQNGANNSAQNNIQYVDTEYYHIGTTKVDIRVEFQDVSYSGNYGYAVFYGCRDQNNYKTAQLGGWIHNSKFFYYDTSEHDGSTAKTDVIYDVRLDKNGSSYANYEDGTRASTLGTGNGAGSSNTYGTDYIFANNQVPNGGKYWPCKCRVYSCKVYTGDTLERDFVPVRCISGAKAGEAGFWCNVTEKFYGNSGYGSLTAGPVVQSETSGGEFHITVAENATLSLANTAKIAGNVKIVKDGAGTLTLPAAGQYFTGGLEVAGGTLAMTQTAAFLAGTPITATAGGTIAIAAPDGASYANDFSLAGGTLKVLASGSGATTTATIDGTLALSLGAGSAQPAVSIDMTDCTSGTFLLNSTTLTVGEGVTAAPGFVATPDATMFEASVEDSTIKVDQLTAPVTAEWTGLGQPGNFDDPDNWSCYNKNGVALSDAVPDVSTVAMRLTDDADWTAKGAVTLGAGVTLDLNGQTLAVASITGDGLVIDTSDDSVIVADDGSVYRKIQYVQATQDGANNSGSGQSDGKPKIQYVDTEYYHVGTTKVDIRVEFQDVSYSDNYRYATYYGCRDQDNYKTAQLGGWLHDSKFYYYDTSEHDGSTAYTGRIYDIRLDKGGSSYANYADGTLASTLGTGNGVGESNTYGTDYIFANNQVPQGGKYWPCKCRVYSCAVYTGDTLERDFVPVLCISGAKAGQAGFWCNVTSKFYGNSGYGSLTAGPLAQGATTASELHFTVAEGQTVSLASAPAIVGNVKIVKDGAGTLTLPATGHYFSGGIEVEAGTLSLGGALAYGGAIDAASGVTVSVPASVGSAGTSVVNFADGGVFEIAGCATANVIGAVTLGGGNISITGTFAPVSGSAACAVTLAGTTTLDFTQWTGAFPVAYPALAFASGANITLKVSPETEALTALARTRNAGTGETGGYLFTWSAIPADATIAPEAGVGGKFKIEPRAGGIWFRAPVGFKMIVY